MKKILILLTLLLSTEKINAEEWTTELYDDTSKYIVESEVRYKFYKIGFIESIYESIDAGHEIDEYDLEDYIYSDYSDWSLEYPEWGSTRVIETDESLISYNTQEFNYISLYYFIVNGNFSIHGIIVTDKNDNYIPYEIEGLKANEINDEGIKLDSSSNMISLLFEKKYDINEVNVKIYYKKDSNLVTCFRFAYTNDYRYHTQNTTLNTYEKCINEYCQLDATYNKSFQEVSVFNKYLFRYKDILYRRDVYGRIYEDGFYTSLDGYEKDIESATVFYKYKNNTLQQEVALSENTYIEENKEEINEIDETTELIEEPVLIDDINQQIAYNDEQIIKTKYNNPLIFGSLFVIIGFTLLVLYYIFKKIREKCHTK